MAGDKLSTFEVKLASINEPKTNSSAGPSEEKINSFLDQYQAGNYNDAEELAISLTQEFPKHHFGWRALGAVFGQAGKNSEAMSACQTAVALCPQDAKAHNNLGAMFYELGRFKEAEASYAQAIALKPDYPQAYYNLGVTLEELRRVKDAVASYTKAIALQSDYTEAHNHLLTCLYLSDEKALFFDELDRLINQDVANAVTGSFTCRSALKYGLGKPNLFCREPLEYVLHTDLNALYDFGKIFVESAKSILNGDGISNRNQSLLRNGHQTSGNLFEREPASTEKIQKIIRSEVEKYRFNFQNSEEGLIKKWPKEYFIYGWLISMKSGGELHPHIHNQGWLSGSIYINVPPKSQADSGSLVVSLGEERDVTDTRINEKKIIDVVTGNLVLFPASLTHYTIPFESEEERIVLAFDVRQSG